MAAVAAALLQPLQQQVVGALLKSLKDRLSYFFVSDDTQATMEGFLERLHLEKVEFNAAHMTSELYRRQIPLEVTGGGVAVIDARFYLAHARLDIIAERCELRLAPQGFTTAFEESLQQIAERQIEEVDVHVRQFFILQKQQELQLRLARLERLLNFHQNDPGAKKELEAEYREVLEQQRAASTAEETPTHSMLEWLLRYLPNVNIRFEDVMIRLDDSEGLLGPPATVELGVKRMIFKPSVSRVPWAFSWGCSGPGEHARSHQQAEPILLGPQLSAPEVKGALAVDVSIRQLQLSIRSNSNNSKESSNSSKDSSSNGAMWMDVVSPVDLQLHLFIQRESESSNYSSNSSNSKSNNNNNNSSSSGQQGPLRWRASVYLLAGERVQVSLDSFSLFCFVCAFNKLHQLRRLKLLNAYRPAGRPTKYPKAWWHFAKMYARLLRRERHGSDDFFSQTEERILHMKRFIRLFKVLLLEYREQQEMQHQQQQQPIVPIPRLSELLRPVLSRHLQRQQQQQQQQQQRRRQTVGQVESDDLFLLLQFARRPFNAIAQWVLFAFRELEAARDMLQQRKDRDLEEQQHLLRRLRLLRQQNAVLQQQQQYTPRSVATLQQQQPDAGAAIALELRANEEEQQLVQQQLQFDVNAKVREKIVSFFSTPSSFCQEARDAAASLERGKNELQQQLLQLQRERRLGRSGTQVLLEAFRQQQRAAAATCRELETHRDTWRVSRHRMLLWAELLGVYESLFPPAAAAALLDSRALAELLEQHRRKVLEENFGPSLTRHSSGLDPVFTRKAARVSVATTEAAAAKHAEDSSNQQLPEGDRRRPSQPRQKQQQQQKTAAAEAAAWITRLLLSLGKTCDLPLPPSLHRRKAGLLLRNVAFRVAPLLTLDTWQQQQQQQQQQQHWLVFEAVDAALELQTLNGASLLCCLRSLELYLCSGGLSVRKQPISSSSSSGGCWQCAFREDVQMPLLRMAQNLDSGSSSSSSNCKIAAQQQQLVPPGAQAVGRSREIRSSSHAEQSPRKSGRQSIWQGAMDAIGVAATAAAAAAAAASASDAESTAARSRRQSLTENPSSSSSNKDKLGAAKAVFQESVQRGIQLQQQLMRHLSFVFINLTSLPLQQQQQQKQQHPLLRIGVPLFLQATARLQHVWGCLRTNQQQLLHLQLQHLLLVVCGAAVASGRGFHQLSDDYSNSTLAFFAGLLTAYKRHNQLLLQRYRQQLHKQRKSDASTRPDSPSLGHPVTLDLAFITDRLAAASRAAVTKQQGAQDILDCSPSKLLLDSEDVLAAAAATAAAPEWQRLLSLVSLRLRVVLPSVHILVEQHQQTGGESSSSTSWECPYKRVVVFGASEDTPDAPASASAAAAAAAAAAAGTASAEQLLNVVIREQDLTVSLTNSASSSGNRQPMLHAALGGVCTAACPSAASLVEQLPSLLLLLQSCYGELKGLLLLLLPSIWGNVQPPRLLLLLQQQLLQEAQAALSRKSLNPQSSSWVNAVYGVVTAAAVKQQLLQKQQQEQHQEEHQQQQQEQTQHQEQLQQLSTLSMESQLNDELQKLHSVAAASRAPKRISSLSSAERQFATADFPPLPVRAAVRTAAAAAAADRPVAAAADRPDDTTTTTTTTIATVTAGAAPRLPPSQAAGAAAAARAAAAAASGTPVRAANDLGAPRRPQPADQSAGAAAADPTPSPSNRALSPDEKVPAAADAAAAPAADPAAAAADRAAADADAAAPAPVPKAANAPARTASNSPAAAAAASKSAPTHSAAAPAPAVDDAPTAAAANAAPRAAAAAAGPGSILTVNTVPGQLSNPVLKPTDQTTAPAAAATAAKTAATATKVAPAAAKVAPATAKVAPAAAKTAPAAAKTAPAAARAAASTEALSAAAAATAAANSLPAEAAAADTQEEHTASPVPATRAPKAARVSTRSVTLKETTAPSVQAAAVAAAAPADRPQQKQQQREQVEQKQEPALFARHISGARPHAAFQRAQEVETVKETPKTQTSRTQKKEQLQAASKLRSLGLRRVRGTPAFCQFD